MYVRITVCQAKASGEAGMLFAKFLTKELGRIKAQSKLHRTCPAKPEEGTQRSAFSRSQGAHSRLRQAPLRPPTSHSLLETQLGRSQVSMPKLNPTKYLFGHRNLCRVLCPETSPT